ncbi:MAG: hypothetical protein LBQ18_03800 [Campylobacteraceae bacterium]|jgi:hypothetical protein|nr:hypothetical protein [Campylobacteraceae bacterium]
MHEYIRDVLSAKIGGLSPENRKIAEALVKKLHSFTHAPLNKKDGLRMLPFIESWELVSTVAAVVKEHKLGFNDETNGFVHPNTDRSIPYYDSVGYYYCIDLLVLYVINKKENYEKIISVLESEIAKENEHSKIKKERGGRCFDVMSRVFGFYKKDTDMLDNLTAKLEKY